ncbi:sialidase family protein [Streptomyces hainanensis]|uniref:exo-alpha-sialidase n=1 Tax=Streptomyces hainanensis TaxID=402648 RepID=A0A4R4T6D2_9ACTN|nr:sialidase family protein [Streptomyces hainanensis]TDC72457.1 exo-alpha-sialidase [Streptomyces hainanensis]
MPIRARTTRMTLLATAVWAIMFTTPPSAVATPRNTPPPERSLSQPFRHDTEGYACYRIPAIVTTTAGTLLAFAEARVADCADIGDIDLVVKRSTDGGRTWGELTVLRGDLDAGGYGNPVPVVDAESGLVTLMYAYNTWTPKPDDVRSRGPRSLSLLHSEDDGLTWRAGAPLRGLKPASWTWISVGPGHGIQLQRGEHAGRLVVAGDHDTTGDRSGGQLYYSDDGGLSWRLGAVWETVEELPNPAELSLVERVDGTLYINARGLDNVRLAAYSEDAGESFTPAGFREVRDLDTPPVSGSLLRLTATDVGDDRDRVLLSAPTRPGEQVGSRRRIMTIRSSYDEGRTWHTVGTVITPARAGYSDLTLLPSGEIGLLYETGRHSPHGALNFTAFTELSLDAGRRELTLPDIVGCPVARQRPTETVAPTRYGRLDPARLTSLASTVTAVNIRYGKRDLR